MKKKPTKLSRKPAAKSISVKEAKPKVEAAKTTAEASGFVTISETRIRKVYR